MDLLIDTNVFLDLALSRWENGNIERLFPTMHARGDRAFLTASSATDMFYIIYKRLRDLDETYNAMRDVLELAQVLSVTEKDIHAAFHARWRDFEDCVQFMTAKHNRMDYIVTRNKRDFEDDSIPVISPDEYLMM